MQIVNSVHTPSNPGSNQVERLENRVMRAEEALSLRADGIIRHYMLMTMGAGALPVLLADILAVTAIQVEMVRQLSHLYDLPFERTKAKAIILALLTNTIAHRGSRSLVKGIPVIGWIFGGLTMSILSGAATLALGKVFKAHLEAGGQWPDLQVEALSAPFRRVLQTLSAEKRP
jgi:uncharacterized protein (DUF697 family)